MREIHLVDIAVVAIGVAVVALLFASPFLWEQGVRLFRRYVTIRPTHDDRYAREIAEFRPATTTPQPESNAIAITETERNALLLRGKADALAALVHAKKVTETEGIKLVFGVGPSGGSKTYQVARMLLKARLAELEAPPAESYRELDEQRRPVLN